MNNVLKITTILLLLLAVLAPALAMAALPTPLPPVNGQRLGLGDVADLVSGVVNFVLWAAGFIVVGFIVYAGITMVSAGSNTTKYADGLKMLKHALIGALVVFGVGLIVNTIARFADNPNRVINGY